MGNVLSWVVSSVVVVVGVSLTMMMAPFAPAWIFLSSSRFLLPSTFLLDSLGFFLFITSLPVTPLFFGLVSSLTAFFFSTGMCEERIA